MGTPQVMQNGASGAPGRSGYCLPLMFAGLAGRSDSDPSITPTAPADPGDSAGAAAAERLSWAISRAGDGIEGGSGGRS